MAYQPSMPAEGGNRLRACSEPQPRGHSTRPMGTSLAEWFGTACRADLVWETLACGSNPTWELGKLLVSQRASVSLPAKWA